jgi:hypothetical protein
MDIDQWLIFVHYSRGIKLLDLVEVRATTDQHADGNVLTNHNCRMMRKPNKAQKRVRNGNKCESSKYAPQNDPVR